MQQDSYTILTPELVDECVDSVRAASPYLQRTPSPSHLLILDKLREHLFLVFECLHGVQQAEYAVGLWRYCLQRGMFREGRDMLIRSHSVSTIYSLMLSMQAATGVGILSKRLGETQVALKFLNRALRASASIRTPHDKAFIYIQLAQVHTLKAEYDRALELIETGKQIACDTNDQWIIASAYNDTGIIHLHRRELALAESAFGKSIQIWETLGEVRRGFETQENRAMVAAEMGNYALAEAQYRKSLTLCRVLNDPYLFAYCCFNLGDICIFTSKIEEARLHLKTAYEQCKDIGHVALQSVIFSSLGQVHFQENDYPNALRLFGYSERLEGELGTPRTLMQQNEQSKVVEVIGKSMRRNTFSQFWNQGKRLTAEQAERLFCQQ